MSPAKQPPDPPNSGSPARARDVRDKFEQLTRQTPRDPEAERAFIEARIRMIRDDSRLSPADKDRLIEELRQRI